MLKIATSFKKREHKARHIKLLKSFLHTTPSINTASFKYMEAGLEDKEVRTPVESLGPFLVDFVQRESCQSPGGFLTWKWSCDDPLFCK